MIPILYEKTETAFTTNGLGRLNCIRCIVTEERNGIYECEFDIPVNDPMFTEVQIGRIIACTHDEEGDVQPFDIYKKSEPINGVVTFYANHISYRLNEITVEPFEAQTCADAIAALSVKSIGSNPFTFSTDKTVTGTYRVNAPASLRPLLGGSENSLLDVYGKGEYVFDLWSVYLHVNRGTDTDVHIRYGKNLAEYQNELDYSACYNGVVPYWLGEVSNEETGDSSQVLVTLTEKYISSGQSLPNGRLVLIPMDLSSDFSEQPTEAQLRTKATSNLSNSSAWLPSQNITVNFVQLWQTEEYKDLAPLEKAKLCDTVLVDVPMYNVTGLRIKIVKVVWNVLLERYDEMELGTPQTTLAATISDAMNVPEQIQSLAQSIEATKVITGNTNQHFWFTESGTDTGAHITEVDRETFLADPSQGGGNLLARSNGIAVRDGLTEISTFSADEIHLGNTVGTRRNGAKITQDSFIFTPPFGSSSFVYREKSGTAEIEQRYKGTGSALAIELLRGDSLAVTVDGVQTTSYILNYSQSEVYGTLLFSSPYPASGSDIVVSYTVSSSTIYEFGIGTSSAPFGVVEGLHCTASGIFSHAEGNKSTASGAFSHAEGFDSKARGSHSHAQNYGTIASGLGQTSMGLYNIEDTSDEYSLLIGNGTEGARSNALAVDWNGNVRIKGTVYAGCNNDSTGGKALPVSVDITSGEDLNSFMDYGNYACGSGAIAQSLSNCPTTVNFSMLVLPKYSNTLVIQVIFAEGNQIYTRTNTSGGWGGWYKFTGTAV